MRRFLKTAALPLFTAGGAGFYYNNYYTSGYYNSKSDLTEEDKMSYFFKDYMTKNHLTIPETYKSYVANKTGEAFLDKAIVKDLGGLGSYHILMEKSYDEVLNSWKNLKPEEKESAISTAKIYCCFTATNKVQGHFGIIHGGFTATLFDNVGGMLAYCGHDFNPVATAYLNISYKKPLKVGTEYIMKMEVKSQEGKKLFVDGTIVDKDDKVYAKAESLFIRVNWMDALVPKVVKDLFTNKPETSGKEKVNKQELAV
jgi:uncharacterized protein (TIGR00369 family)